MAYYKITGKSVTVKRLTDGELTEMVQLLDKLGITDDPQSKNRKGGALREYLYSGRAFNRLFAAYGIITKEQFLSITEDDMRVIKGMGNESILEVLCLQSRIDPAGDERRLSKLASVVIEHREAVANYDRDKAAWDAANETVNELSFAYYRDTPYQLSDGKTCPVSSKTRIMASSRGASHRLWDASQLIWDNGPISYKLAFEETPEYKKLVIGKEPTEPKQY